jgi:hypothetical protein
MKSMDLDFDLALDPDLDPRPSTPTATWSTTWSTARHWIHDDVFGKVNDDDSVLWMLHGRQHGRQLDTGFDTGLMMMFSAKSMTTTLDS